MSTTPATATAEQLKASRRLYDLADEARTERRLWTTPAIRSDLADLALQLEDAARAALSHDEGWADGWAEAGVLSIRRYIGSRKFLEAITGGMA